VASIDGLMPFWQPAILLFLLLIFCFVLYLANKFLSLLSGRNLAYLRLQQCESLTQPVDANKSSCDQLQKPEYYVARLTVVSSRQRPSVSVTITECALYASPCFPAFSRTCQSRDQRQTSIFNDPVVRPQHFALHSSRPTHSLTCSA